MADDERDFAEEHANEAVLMDRSEWMEAHGVLTQPETPTPIVDDQTMIGQDATICSYTVDLSGMGIWITQQNINDGNADPYGVPYGGCEHASPEQWDTEIFDAMAAAILEVLDNSDPQHAGCAEVKVDGIEAISTDQVTARIVATFLATDN